MTDEPALNLQPVDEAPTDVPQLGIEGREPVPQIWTDDGGPILTWTLPQPLDLHIALMTAVGEACKKKGWEAYYREETGFGTMYVKKKAK
jgi:hypothetical protein